MGKSSLDEDLMPGEEAMHDLVWSNEVGLIKLIVKSPLDSSIPLQIEYYLNFE